MTNPTTGNEQKALAALRYYRHECSGAEPSISVFHQMVDEALAAPVQANAPGLIAAAEHLERQADLYAQDHASNEPDTGAVVFHRGEAGREYHSTLVELAEELRGLAHEVPVLPAAPVQAVPAPAAVALTDALRDLIEAIEYTPLGLRQIKALERAREAIAASTATPKAVPADDDPTSKEQYRRMFHAAISDLASINEALDLDPDDDGAEPILAAIKELQAAPEASPAAVAGPAWGETRNSLAMLMMGFASRQRPSVQAACAALDSATEPDMPLAYLRGVASAAVAPDPDAEFCSAIEQRDTAEGWADGLAALIGKYFGQAIGEHSSAHNPWQEAKDIIEEAAPYSPPVDASPAAVAAQKAELRRAVATAPERIWLDCGGDDALDSDFGDLIDVTWSRDNATGFGIEYVRALAAAPVTQAAEPVIAEPVTWWNGCNRSVPAALRYLADHERPEGGESRFNSMHLIQLAGEIEMMASMVLYTEPQAEPAAAQQFRAILHAEVHAAIDPAGDIARQESAIDTADHLLAEFNKLFPGA